MPNSVCLLSSGQVGFSDCQLSITGGFYYHQLSEKILESKYRAVLEEFYVSDISFLETALEFILFFSSISFTFTVFVQVLFLLLSYSVLHCSVGNKFLSDKAEDARYSRMFCIKSGGSVVILDSILQKFYMRSAVLTCRWFYILRALFENCSPGRSNDMKMMDC